MRFAAGRSTGIVSAAVSGARIAALAGLTALAAASHAAAQSYGQFVREANTNTISIVSSAPGETALEITHDLATVLHCVDGLRIIPIAGRGDRNNVYDLLFLRGIDMAIVRADVLDYLEETGEFTDDLKQRILYIAPLFEQELHLIAPTSVASIADLQGKIVNMGAPGTLGLAARRLLQAQGVDVVETKLDNSLALERVIDGGVDAMFLVGGKPIPLLRQLERVNGLHLVPLPSLNQPVYNTGEFTQDDYPTLVPPGQSIPTVTVRKVLAAYNWPADNERYEKNALFTRALFKRASYLRRPARHPKWADGLLTESVPGWGQFAPAKEIVDKIREERGLIASAGPAPAAAPTEEAMMGMFQRQLDEFGITPRTDEERALLFAAFKRRIEASQR